MGFAYRVGVDREIFGSDPLLNVAYSAQFSYTACLVRFIGTCNSRICITVTMVRTETKSSTVYNNIQYSTVCHLEMKMSLSSKWVLMSSEMRALYDATDVFLDASSGSIDAPYQTW